jgi:hypothetical protein
MSFSRHARRLAPVLATLAAGALAACSDGPAAPAARPVGPSLHVAPLDTPYTTTVCKVGPSGTFQFTVSGWPDRVDNEGLSGTVLVPVPFNVSSGQCVDVFRGGELMDAIHVSEVNLPAGVTLEKIVVQLKGGDCAVLDEFCPITYTNQSQVSLEVFMGKGYTVTFYNKGETPPPPPPTGGQGCTPGFWKNSTGSWVGYSPNQDFDAVFGVNAFNPDRTLLAALGSNGGGVNALARHATAALLNASNAGVQYDLTSTQIIAMVKAALAPGGDIEATKNKLAAFNEQGCPLANDASFKKK